MKRTLLLIMVAALFSVADARTPKAGDVVRIRANSMWFDSHARLLNWMRNQDLAEQQELINQRAAWQFGGELTVRVLEYLPQERVVKVVMILSPGHQDHRFDGVQWWLEDKDIE